MQCSTCETILASDADYCYNCGAPAVPPVLNASAQELPAGTARSQLNDVTLIPQSPFAFQVNSVSESTMLSSLPVSAESYGATSWNEFSGKPETDSSPLSTAGTILAASELPGRDPSVHGYPPGPPPLPFVSELLPASPKRKPVLVMAVLVSLLVLLIIFGSVFVGIQIGKAQGKASVASHSQPAASSTPDASQLYQQVTSQVPSFTDPLTDAASSPWAVFTAPTHSCQIRHDGLHVAITDSNKFTYCMSGRGTFRSFAFQVTMNIVSGDGGGLILRDDITTGDFYYFHVLPDGSYHIYINTNKQLGAELDEGTINPGSFTSGFGRKNTLTAIAQGSRIAFYASGQFITSIQDSTYSTGYLGVLGAASNAPGETVYTNAKIWVL